MEWRQIIGTRLAPKEANSGDHLATPTSLHGRLTRFTWLTSAVHDPRRQWLLAAGSAEGGSAALLCWRQLPRSVFRCVNTVQGPPGDNQGTAQRPNNGTASSELDSAVGTESRGSWEKKGGCLEVLHCSCWMMGIKGLCDAGWPFIFSSRRCKSSPTSWVDSLETPLRGQQWSCLPVWRAPHPLWNSSTQQKHAFFDLCPTYSKTRKMYGNTGLWGYGFIVLENMSWTTTKDVKQTCLQGYKASYCIYWGTIYVLTVVNDWDANVVLEMILWEHIWFGICW